MPSSPSILINMSSVCFDVLFFNPSVLGFNIPSTFSAPLKYLISTGILSLFDCMASANLWLPSVTNGTPSSLTCIKIGDSSYPFSFILFFKSSNFLLLFLVLCSPIIPLTSFNIFGSSLTGLVKNAVCPLKFPILTVAVSVSVNPAAIALFLSSSADSIFLSVYSLPLKSFPGLSTLNSGKLSVCFDTSSGLSSPTFSVRFLNSSMREYVGVVLEYTPSISPVISRVPSLIGTGTPAFSVTASIILDIFISAAKSLVARGLTFFKVSNISSREKPCFFNIVENASLACTVVASNSPKVL